MTEFNDFVNIEDIIKKITGAAVCEKFDLESFTIYGKSGFKNKIEYVEGTNFYAHKIGSLHIKYINTESMNAVSILIFASGKLKISGGLSKVKSNHKNYMENVLVTIISFLTGSIADFIIPKYTISMLNAQIRIDMIPQLFRKFLFTLQKSGNYISIQEPALSGRGRISSAKIYPFNGRRTHFAVDPKGSVQMFAFKTFEEVEAAVETFISHLKN